MTTAESIITNERYVYIASIIKGCYKKKNAGKLSVSDKIDRVVTNRFLALPDLCGCNDHCILCIHRLPSVPIATDWVNDGVFGDGWHLFGIGTSDYEDAADEYVASRRRL